VKDTDATRCSCVADRLGCDCESGHRVPHGVCFLPLFASVPPAATTFSSLKASPGLGSGSVLFHCRIRAKFAG